MHHHLRFFLFIAALFTAVFSLRAQNTITTQTLGISSVCPGSPVSVPFTRTGTYDASNVFTVQLSDGGDYKNIETGAVAYNSATGIYTVNATIPANQAAGTTYSLRVTASNPAVVGTPSTTKLTVKVKPAPPNGTSPQYDCQFRSATANANVYLPYTTLSLKDLIPNSTVTFYDENNNKLEFTRGDYSDPNSTSRTFKSPAYLNGAPGTRTLRVTQTVNDCESDDFVLQLIIKPQPEKGPQITLSEIVQAYPVRPVFPVAIVYPGRVTVCQGGNAVPINAYHASPPPGFVVRYMIDATGESSTTPFTPQTTNAGRILYQLANVPTDPNAGCSNHGIYNTYIAVDVIAHPTKPTVPTNVVSLCQSQQAAALSASVTTNGASLVWYGNNSTGGTGSTAATVPSTDKAGTFKYYVAQKVNDCEGERAEITVVVKERPAPPSVQAENFECDRAIGSLNVVAPIAATATTANATLKLFHEDGSLVPSTSIYSASANGFMVYKSDGARTIIYYISQQVDGCESEKIKTKLIIKPLPPTVTPLNPFGTAPLGGPWGKISYCQGDKALSLKDFGIKPLPENVVIQYIKESGDLEFSGEPPVPNTSKPGSAVYTFRTALNGCPSSIRPTSNLTITVHARPVKPTVSTSQVSICQFQQAGALTASTTDAGASLVWYGTNATEGTGSTAASVPLTDKAGTFKYYVAQKLNDCEGERAEITVEVKAASPAPAVTDVNYCQGGPANQLSAVAASGGTLNWYTSATGGTGSAVGPTPPTNTAGTQTYYVAQTVGGNCESQRVTVKVIVNPLPSAPTTPKPTYAFCQFAQGEVLLADGQNLKWYDSATGGGSAGSITPGTETVGTKSYYVSQTVNGCEGPRTAVAITIKPLPTAPGVTQRNICQFTNPEFVVATGVNLKWYNPDGNKFDTTPIINTDKGGAFSYQVTQTVDGCEGPKATLSVNVLTTPSPTVARTTVELCQGAIAQPLQATGDNLKWTDPNGVVSTTAPVPPTSNPTTKPEGDVYYVTQTGTNTCESPKVAIKVFVQTVPSMLIGGSTTTNLGLEVPLKLAFTGVGPYTYRLSTGLTGTATKDTTILVLPERTTTYQVAEVKNKCGAGMPGAAATVSVLIPGIQTLALATTSLCVGTSLSTGFLTTGSFNTGSVFKLQIAKVEADSTKINFLDVLNSTTQNGQISGVIPTSVAAGTYFVRVMATNPKIPINGTISPSILTVKPIAMATLTGTQNIYEGESAKLSVAFTGDAPWVFSYRDSTAAGLGVVQTVQTATNPHVLEVKPLKTATYFLTAISNVCGNNTPAKTLIIVTVNPLLGIEDQSLVNAVDVYPVPAAATLTVRIRGLSVTQSARLELIDGNRRTTWLHETRRETSILSLDQQPAGTYLLRIRVGDRTATKRILKL